MLQVRLHSADEIAAYTDIITRTLYATGNDVPVLPALEKNTPRLSDIFRHPATALQLAKHAGTELAKIFHGDFSPNSRARKWLEGTITNESIIHRLDALRARGVNTILLENRVLRPLADEIFGNICLGYAGRDPGKYLVAMRAAYTQWDHQYPLGMNISAKPSNMIPALRPEWDDGSTSSRDDVTAVERNFRYAMQIQLPRRLGAELSRLPQIVPAETQNLLPQTAKTEIADPAHAVLS